MPSKKSKSLPWDIVEKSIAREQKWLQETIENSPYEDKHNFNNLCQNCILRQIAILIVSGKIKARNITSKICLWGNKRMNIKVHGKEWHADMMSLVAGHFKSLGFRVAIEPNLNVGQADVGVYKKGKRNLFVEIGTLSFSKLLSNLKSMENTNFLIVLGPKHAMELSVQKADFKFLER